MINRVLCLTSQGFREFESIEERGGFTSIDLYDVHEGFVSLPDLDPVPASRFCYEGMWRWAWPAETLALEIDQVAARPGTDVGLGESVGSDADTVRLDAVTATHTNTGRVLYAIDVRTGSELAAQATKARLDRLSAGVQFAGASRPAPLGSQGAISSPTRIGNAPLRFAISDTTVGAMAPAIRVPTRVVMLTLSGDITDATGTTTVHLTLNGSTVSGSSLSLSSTQPEISLSCVINLVRGSQLRAVLDADGGHGGINLTCDEAAPL